MESIYGVRSLGCAVLEWYLMECAASAALFFYGVRWHDTAGAAEAAHSKKRHHVAALQKRHCAAALHK